MSCIRLEDTKTSLVQLLYTYVFGFIHQPASYNVWVLLGYYFGHSSVNFQAWTFHVQ